MSITYCKKGKYLRKVFHQTNVNEGLIRHISVAKLFKCVTAEYTGHNKYCSWIYLIVELHMPPSVYRTVYIFHFV